jgi:hypothetical protein
LVVGVRALGEFGTLLAEAAGLVEVLKAPHPTSPWTHTIVVTDHFKEALMLSVGHDPEIVIPSLQFDNGGPLRLEPSELALDVRHRRFIDLSIGGTALAS